MKIVIIGNGKVGLKLATQLSEEDYDVILIDQDEELSRDDFSLCACPHA